MPRVRDQERSILEKIRKLQGQLTSQHRRVSAFIYQSDAGIEIEGTNDVVKFLKNLENEAKTLSSVCQEAGLREALAIVQANQDQDCPSLDQKKRLIVPLSMANYDEMKKWLVEDMKAEVIKKGFVSTGKNTVYSYDKRSANSTDEHEKRRPDQWPEDCIKWSDISYGICQLGASFGSIPKSDLCPPKPLEFFRMFIKKRLEASGFDPDEYYTKSKAAEKRIRIKSRITHATQNMQVDISTHQNVESQRPSPEELAENRSFNANSSINSRASSNNNSYSESNSSMSNDMLICHICKGIIPEEEDPILCDCSTEKRNVFVHWACICEGCPLAQEISPEHIGLCHLCNDSVTVENMHNGNILLCHCDTNDKTFVHYKCLQNRGCDE